MYLKNKICNLLSYVFIILAIILNFTTLFFTQYEFFLFDYSGLLSGLFFIIGAVSIFRSRAYKDKIIEQAIEKFLQINENENIEILSKNTQLDTFTVKINDETYNLNAVLTNDGLVIMKQLADIDTEFYVENSKKQNKHFVRKFNYMQDTINILEELKKEED